MLSWASSGKFGNRGRFVKHISSALEKNPVLRPDSYIGIRKLMNEFFFILILIRLSSITAYTQAGFCLFIPIYAYKRN